MQSECVISKIVSTALSTRAKCIGSDCTAKIEVTCDPPVAMETATEFAPLALFVLRNRGKTIATGQCERILESVGLNTIT